MTIIGKGFIQKTIKDFKKVEDIVESHYDSISDSMSVQESRNVFIRMKRELGEIIDTYNRHEK